MTTPTLDAGEDRLIVDAFDRACAAYPRAYGGDAIVDGVAAGSDDSDDALLGGAAPAEPHAAALAMPPAGAVPPAGARRRHASTRGRGGAANARGRRDARRAADAAAGRHVRRPPALVVLRGVLLRPARGAATRCCGGAFRLIHVILSTTLFSWSDSFRSFPAARNPHTKDPCELPPWTPERVGAQLQTPRTAGVGPDGLLIDRQQLSAAA